MCEQGIKYTPPFADTTSNSGGMQWEGSAQVGEGGVPHHSPRRQYTDRPKPTPCLDQDLCSRSIGGKHRFCNDNRYGTLEGWRRCGCGQPKTTSRELTSTYLLYTCFVDSASYGCCDVMAASAMGLPEMAEERPPLSDVTISDLPLELLETILAHLALADDGHIDLNAVGVCMCVHVYVRTCVRVLPVTSHHLTLSTSVSKSRPHHRSCTCMCMCMSMSLD